MDKFRHSARSERRRKRNGAGRSNGRRRASIALLLAVLTVCAAAAFVTQAMHHPNRVAAVAVSTEVDAKQGPISGVASVIDGDTIEIHGQRIRFNGIDAPESKQHCDDAKGVDYACGRRSAAALETFLQVSSPIKCTFVTWDRYRRFVGDCQRADGTGVAAWMVEHGHAMDWPRYSQGAYAAQQAKAETAKVGIWVGTFEAPWEWRAEHAESAPSSTSTPFGVIKRPLVAQSRYSCEPRRYCSQIGSCGEARWYLENCSWGGKLDRDKDGVPCEGLC